MDDNLKNTFMTAEQVSKELGCSIAKAYKICRELNQELSDMGYKTMRGRVLTSYLFNRYGLTEESLANI